MSDLLHRDLPEIVAALAARVDRLESAPAASGAAVGTCNTFCGVAECERADPGQCRRGDPPAASGAAGTEAAG